MDLEILPVTINAVERSTFVYIGSMPFIDHLGGRIHSHSFDLGESDFNRI